MIQSAREKSRTEGIRYKAQASVYAERWGLGINDRKAVLVRARDSL